VDYVRGLSAGVKANCWQLAEAAGHANPYRMQALLRTCRWRWEDLRSGLPALALAWLPHDADDLIGPGIAFDETAQLKDGDATACVAPQHAGCTGHVENCVTTVYAVWVTTAGQAWADSGVFMPERWEKDRRRRRAAGIPGSLRHKTKPQLAREQLERLLDVRMPARWIAFDEVYTRSSRLRGACEERGLPYVGIAPRDFRITLPSGKVIKAEEALRDAVFERRSCGNGSKGPRYSDWALIATASPRRFLLIRRSVSRPDHVTFCICWAPQEVPATMTLFVSIAGRRWPCEETFKAGKDIHGWDQCQARGFEAICRHSALTALAQLRHAAIRNALCGDITVTASSQQQQQEEEEEEEEEEKKKKKKKKKKAELEQESAADLGIPLGDAPVPSRPGQPCPSGIAAIKLTIAETARLARLARQHAAGLISDARLAFHLRWSRWRRRHQARARWHHYSARLAAAATVTDANQKEVTLCNRRVGTITSQNAA
jgi:SRSO17 transposase